MGAQAAHSTTISVGGAPVDFIDEATTKVTANTVYQITDTTKRRLDPATDVTVEVDAAGNGTWVAAAADTFEVDYLFAKVTFDTDQGGTALVRASGKYIPVVPVGQAKDVTISITNELEDTPIFGDGYKTRTATLKDFSGELNGLQVPNVDLDSGAGTVKLSDYLDNGSPLLLEVDKGGGDPVFRAWVKIPELGHKLAGGSLYASNMKFMGHSFQGAGQTEFVAWGYGS